MPEATKLTSVVTYDEGLPITKSDDDLDKWLCDSRDKLKTLNPIYHNTYCHQTCYIGDLLLHAEADLGLLQHPRWSAL